MKFIKSVLLIVIANIVFLVLSNNIFAQTDSTYLDSSLVVSQLSKSSYQSLASEYFNLRDALTTPKCNCKTAVDSRVSSCKDAKCDQVSSGADGGLYTKLDRGSLLLSSDTAYIKGLLRIDSISKIISENLMELKKELTLGTFTSSGGKDHNILELILNESKSLTYILKDE